MKNVFKLKIKEILDLLIEFVYLAIVFITPLYFSFAFPTYNVFELSKTAVFEILTFCLLFLTAAKFIFFFPTAFNLFGDKQQTIKWCKKYLLVPTLFIFGLSLTLFFSSDPRQSFFGSYERQAGYLNYLFYFVWFVLVVVNIRTTNNQASRSRDPEQLSEKINRLISVASISGFLVAAYGILQIMGIDFLSWPENPLFTRRTISTFGQPNFLASWLLLIIPLSFYLVYINKKFLGKFFYSLILAVQLICLFFTSSRGGIIAFGLTALVFIIYLLVFAQTKKLYKTIATICLLLTAVGSLVGLNFLLPGRFNGLFDLQNGSMAARLNFYQAAEDAIIKKPLFGYGMENSGEILINYYLPEWGIHGDVGATTDRAHNLILDILLSGGFFALALYGTLYIYYFRLSVENIREKKIKAVSLALSLGALAYLFSLLFSFAIVVGEVYFWLFLALLAVLNSGDASHTDVAISSQTKKISSRIKQWALLAGVFILAVLGVNYEFKVLTADYYFNRIYYTLESEEYFTVFTLVEYMNKVAFNPVNREYYDLFLGDKLSDFYPDITAVPEKRLVFMELNIIDKRLGAKTLMGAYTKGKINSVLGNYRIAENYFYYVLDKSPLWPKTYIEMGRLYARENNYRTAVANYNLALSSLPDIYDSRFNDSHRSILRLYLKLIYREIGDIYFLQANYQAAEKAYRSAYRSEIGDYTLLKKIANTYYQRGDLKSAYNLNQRGAERNPSDSSWSRALISLAIEENKIDLAKSLIVAARIKYPEETIFVDLANKYELK